MSILRTPGSTNNSYNITDIPLFDCSLYDGDDDDDKARS